VLVRGACATRTFGAPRLHEEDLIPVKTRGIWLFALGVAGSCLISGPIASEAGHDDPGPPVAEEAQITRFLHPADAVVAFLEAVKARDAVRLRNATSIHAPTEAVPKNQALFRAIVERSLSKDDLTKLASELEGFQTIVASAMRKSGKARFYVRKPGPNGTQYERTFTTRWHKELGWKVSDIGEQRELVKPIPTQPKS
jgi:hypothetical protein